MDAQQVRYATTTDGINVAYSVVGDGPPLVVASGIWTSHLTVGWRYNNEALTEMAQHTTLIRYDGRGSGLSDREPLDFSLDARVRDLEAVVDDACPDQFSLYAGGHGCLAAVAFAVKHPDRVTRLVLSTPYASGEEFYRGSPRMRFVTLLESVTEEQWDFVVMTMATRVAANDSDRASGIAELIKSSITPEALLAFRNANLAIDISSLLTQLTVPTLVIHSLNDDVQPVSFTRQVSSLIPNAQLLPIERMGGPIFYSREERVAVLRFLGVKVPAISPIQAQSGSLRTVLFTDLVGHTEMMSRLGDAKGRDVLREHERITREVLKANGGTEVKTMGDGFMASFGSVTKAVECAIALQRAFAGSEGEALNVRVGLNAGEPIEEDGDLFGATVILASRIAAKADGGEILVADTVRGLCSGKGFLFADRGEFVAKGFEDPVRIYEVNWRD